MSMQMIFKTQPKNICEMKVVTRVLECRHQINKIQHLIKALRVIKNIRMILKLKENKECNIYSITSQNLNQVYLPTMLMLRIKAKCHTKVRIQIKKLVHQNKIVIEVLIEVKL